MGSQGVVVISNGAGSVYGLFVGVFGEGKRLEAWGRCDSISWGLATQKR